MRSRVRLALLAALVSGPARADWQYTKWGMTPEQLVAASGGGAVLLPEGRRVRVPPLVTMATGEFQDGPLMLRTVFSFTITGGGLACVTYGAAGPDDAAPFKALLVRRYGPPQRRSGLPAIGLEGLGWKSATDVIDASFSKEDAPFAMHCKPE